MGTRPVPPPPAWHPYGLAHGQTHGRKTMSKMLGGSAAGSARRRPSLTWVLAGVGAVIVVALVGTAVWIGQRPAAQAESPAAASESLSPSAGSARPTPTLPAFSVAALPGPHMEELLPRGLPLTKIDTLAGLPGTVAVPKKDRVPVWTGPDADEMPVLALESTYYDAVARWLVVDSRPGWVKVLIPYGRLALPSQDPSRVNGASGWLREDDVVLREEKRSVVVDLSERTVTVEHADGTTDQVRAAIGAAATPTPRGLTQVFTVTEAVNTGLSVFLSLQSESLDGFYGNDYAATAIHVGTDQGEAASNGCLRLTSTDLEKVTHLDPGVPVLIRA